jgi:hypothetical protein
MPLMLKAARRAMDMPTLYFPCPRANYRTQLCFALCAPVDGMGECGRAAGHAHLGRTQKAILVAKLRTMEERGESATSAM